MSSSSEISNVEGNNITKENVSASRGNLLYIVVFVAMGLLLAVLFSLFLLYSILYLSLKLKKEENGKFVLFEFQSCENYDGACYRGSSMNVWIPGVKKDGFISPPFSSDSRLKIDSFKIVYDSEKHTLVDYVDHFFMGKEEDGTDIAENNAEKTYKGPTRMFYDFVCSYGCWNLDENTFVNTDIKSEAIRVNAFGFKDGQIKAYIDCYGIAEDYCLAVHNAVSAVVTVDPVQSGKLSEVGSK